MAKKIILIFTMGTLVTAIMFFSLVKDEKNILIIGDSLLLEENNFSNVFTDYISSSVNSINSDYVVENITSRTFYDLMNFNEIYGNNEYTILQLIYKADIIIISLGTDEINSNGNVKLYLYYLDKILEKVSSINTGTVFISGIYLSDVLVSNINLQISDLCKKYDFIYIDVSQDTKEEEIDHNLLGNKLISIYEKIIS